MTVYSTHEGQSAQFSPDRVDKLFTCFVVVSFFSQVTKVTHVDGDSSVRFSSETSFVVDKYEIL